MAAFAPIQTETGNRRADIRYPINAQLHYQLHHQNLVEVGSGRTVDLSEGGILFETSKSLPPGLKIEVSIDWPSRAPNGAMIEVRIVGHTVRAQGNRTAVKISQYEYRN